MRRGPARLAAASMAALLLLATAGRSLGAVLRDQSRAYPANGPIREAADAAITRLAVPGARPVLLPEVKHLLKRVGTGDRAANLAAYGDPDSLLAPGVVDAVANFVRTGSRSAATAGQ